MGGSWLNFLIFALVIGAPTIGSIWKKLEEKKELRRIESMRERSRNELLRTGRVAKSQPPQSQTIQSRQSSPQSPPTDIASQRRARLEELRRRQQERLRQAAQSRQSQIRQPQARPTQPRPVPTRQPQVRSIPTSRAPSPQSRALPSAVRPQPVRAQRQPRPVAPPPTRRQQPTPHGSDLGKSIRERSDRTKPNRISSRDRAPTESAVQSTRGSPMQRLFATDRPTTADLRRAVLLREVFDPPVSMRSDPPGSF